HRTRVRRGFPRLLAHRRLGLARSTQPIAGHSLMELEEAFEKIRRQLSKSVDPTLSQRIQSMQENAFKPSPSVFAELTPIEEGLLKAFSELSRPATRAWNLDSDPNVPVEFKRQYRALSQSESRRRRKLIALRSLISAGNPKSLNNPLRAYGVK